MNKLMACIYMLSGNVGDKLDNLGNNIFTTWVVPIAKWAGIAGIIVCGIMMMVGKRSREEAKAWLPWVFGGCLIVFAASAIIEAFTSQVSNF